MKQAVVVIHGMGEQRPMHTVRTFVEAVWTSDRALDVLAHDGTKRIWTVPDARLNSHEMVRIRTNRLALTPDADGVLQPGPSTDFYEFYWQHLMGTSRWQHVIGWVVPLLLRSPSRVPEPLRTPWRVLVAFSAALTAIVALRTLGGTGPFEWVFGPALGKSLAGALALLTAASGALGARYVLPYLGDASRYLDNAPGNVKVRNDIRTEGLRLLRALNDSGEYDRIVVVGHSLGSVIGYDVLRLLWADSRTPRTERRDRALADLEAASVALRDAPSRLTRRAFRDAQQAFSAFLATEGETPGPRWAISDFVTLGSPLAHAEVLLAKDREDFDAMVAERALPVCPPVLESIQGLDRLSYRVGSDDVNERRWQTHHAAVFGAVRWTNIYFPYDGLLRGDMVGGPVAPLFGPGVEDVAVRSSGKAGLGCHVHYWTADPNVGEHVMALRDALDLGRVVPKLRPPAAPADPGDAPSSPGE